MNGDNHVRPGDLITAESWNNLVNQISTLESRVAELEKGGGVGDDLVITEVRFSPPLKVGDDVTVIGRNFGVAQVFIDQTPINNFKAGTTDSRLIFTIPPLPGLTAPRVAALRVINPATGRSATRDVIVHPADPFLDGNIFVDWLDANPQTIKAGDFARFFYSVRSAITAPASFVVDPVLNGPSWNVDFQILDAAGVAIPTRGLALNPAETREFSVRFRIPAGTDETPFRFGVNFLHGGRAFGTSALTVFTVNQPIPTADPRIKLSYSDFDVEPLEDQVSHVEGNQIAVRVNSTVLVEFALKFSALGTYEASVDLGPGTTGWDVSLVPPNQFQITDAGGLARTFRPRLAVKPTSVAAPRTGEVVLQVKSKEAGETRTQTRRFSLERLAG